MSQDLVNSLFESGMACMLLLNIRRILRDKSLRGYDWRVQVFVTVWGVWNVYYYTHLNQWFSFLGGGAVMLTNLWYTWLIIYFRKR